MISRIRAQLGPAGFAIAVVALVAALAGGAYAASGGLSLTGKQKKEVKKIAQAEAKKAQGTGPAGPQGPAGAAGKDGANGKDGTNGIDGTDGAAGKSVEVGTATSGPTGECKDGGATVQVAGEPSTKKFVCNGETGFTETLPPGETETGTWATGVGGEEVPDQYVPISFPIPLEAAPELTIVWLSYPGDGTNFEPSEITEILEEGADHGCRGFDEEGVPLADPGHLCVYASYLFRMKPAGTGLTNTIRSPAEPAQIYTGGSLIPDADGGGKAAGVNQVGTTLQLKCEQHDCYGLGVWAVTAEE